MEQEVKNDDENKQWKLRRLYSDKKLHSKIIEILATLLVSRSGNSLEEECTGTYPIDAGK